MMGYMMGYMIVTRRALLNCDSVREYPVVGHAQ